METIELADGGLLLYDDAFLPPGVADRYFAELRDQSAWEQKPGVFGHLQPRLTASYGDEGVTYRYAVVVRLHLKGFENFKVTNGKVKPEGSVSLRDGTPVVRLWKDGKEGSPLDSKSPYWMEIQMVGSDGKPAKDIPLKDGFFEIQLPKEFFRDNPKSITVNWIDFYRN